MLLLTGEGVGVGETPTVTEVLRLEKMLPPKARYNENKDKKPSTLAAMILFLSVGDFPAKMFINLISQCFEFKRGTRTLSFVKYKHAKA